MHWTSITSKQNTVQEIYNKLIGLEKIIKSEKEMTTRTDDVNGDNNCAFVTFYFYFECYKTQQWRYADSLFLRANG